MTQTMTQTDLHTARGEWGGTVYPVVPGHEIVGRVAEVGDAVATFRGGDLVGVGCLVDAGELAEFHVRREAREVAMAARRPDS